MPYAEKTKVPVGQTKSEIEREVMKRNGSAFGVMQERDRAMVIFAIGDRRIRFILHLPAEASYQVICSRWRALGLVIKAKLESVDAGIETLEDAFMAHIVMPDDSTVSEHIRPRIAQAYATGTMPALLPPTKD
ncbi:hypothetical protein [Fulvimarina endophytica]|nr:hypothetical protein [Fulvimarina endophytica]